MPTSHVYHEVCQTGFVSNREAIKLNSQAVAKFDFPFSPRHSTSREIFQQPREPEPDFWVSRVSSLQTQIDIRFEPQLFLQIRKSAQLFESLKYSLVYAELWAQLGLIGSLVDRCVQSTRMPGFCFNVLFRNVSTIQDIDNLRPPASVRQCHLSSIGMRLEYSLKDRCCTHNMSVAQEKKIFVRLLDAALRSFICKDPTRIRGISEIGSKPATSLSTLAPSTFVPRYAELMADRVRLLEPITKTLLMYQDLVKKKPGSSSSKTTGQATGSSSMIDAELISAGLWMTLANSLWDDRQAKRLPPLKLETQRQAHFFSDRELEHAAECSMFDTCRVFAASEKHRQASDCLLLDDLDKNQRQDYAEIYRGVVTTSNYTVANPWWKPTGPLTLALNDSISECELSTDLFEAQAWKSKSFVWDGHDTHVNKDIESSDSAFLSGTNPGLGRSPVQKTRCTECESTTVIEWLEDISSLYQPLLHQIWQDESTYGDSLFESEDKSELPKWVNSTTEEVGRGQSMILHEDTKHETEQNLVDFPNMLD